MSTTNLLSQAIFFFFICFIFFWCFWHISSQVFAWFSFSVKDYYFCDLWEKNMLRSQSVVGNTFSFFFLVSEFYAIRKVLNKQDFFCYFWKNLSKKIKVVFLRWNLVLRPLRICQIWWWCSFVLFWTGDTFCRHIWPKKSKLSI